LFVLVALIVVAMFALTAYNLGAPRSPLNKLLKKKKDERAAGDSALIAKLATSARPGKRTTRTTLAIVGFSLLGVAVVAVFGLSGQGVRDLRTQALTAIATLVTAISGFYFGTRAAQSSTGGGSTSGSSAAPTVTGVNPPSGPVAGGGIVTVTGTGFTGATGVNFGKAAASGLAVASDGTSLTVTVPAAADTGPVDVTVTTPAGTSAATPPADQFTYAAAPTVTGVSQPTGKAGDTVTVSGTSFTNASGVNFGAVAASDLVVLSDTSLTVTVPAAAGEGPVDVTVTTPAGTSAATRPADQFTYSP
jgi:hypothetical protein